MKMVTIKITWNNGDETYVYMGTEDLPDVVRALQESASIAKVVVL